MASLEGIDVVVLAGGLGTRLRTVLGDRPKVLAPVGGRPFLDHLLARLAAEGAGRVILSLGHLAKSVLRHLETGHQPLPVLASVEPKPLGTAGAIRFVAARLQGDPVLVMNGDTWLDCDFGAFLTAHRAAGRTASLLCVAVDDVERYGSVEVAADGSLARFVEKDPARSGRGLINGGIYLFSAAALDDLARMPGPSLERDFLGLLPPGSIHAHVAAGAAFIDIGTPESLAAAAAVIARGTKST